MAWVESHEEIGDHNKTHKLAEILGCSVATAVGTVHLLWHYTLKVSWQFGDLSKQSHMAIARACWWVGDPKILVSGFVESGFIEKDMRVHDWAIYAKELIYQRLYNSRRKDKKTNSVVTAVQTDVVKATTLPNPTLPNQTQPKNKPMRKDGAQQNPKDGFGSFSGLEEEAFLRFWKFYPKKRSKGDAEKAWKSIKPGSELVEKILDAIARAKTSRDWLKENGKFVPYPASWLRSRGWEDEYEGVAPTAPGADVRRKILEVQGLIPVGGDV